MNDNIKEFKKVTVGFVIQDFERDENGTPKCVNQAFFCTDDVTFENDNGEVISSQDDAYQNFDMILK